MNTSEDPSFQIPALPKRRVLIDDFAVSGLPVLPDAVLSLPDQEPAKPPQDIEDRKGETRRVVKRLLAIIEDHRISALRMGFRLDMAALETVIRALEAEIRNENPADLLTDSDEIRSYILTSLYEELLAEPSNILHTTHIAEDVIRYEAMEVAFWKECVAALRMKLIRVS